MEKFSKIIIGAVLGVISLLAGILSLDLCKNGEGIEALTCFLLLLLAFMMFGAFSIASFSAAFEYE